MIHDTKLNNSLIELDFDQMISFIASVSVAKAVGITVHY